MLISGCAGALYRNPETTSANGIESSVSQQKKIYAVRNVNIIPMTIENNVLENATILIENGKIASINKAVPEDVDIIEGKGKWLIPGLIDMHVHNMADIDFSSSHPTKGVNLFTDDQDFMLLYIANGVTTAFELEGRVEHFGQRNAIARGSVIGPRIALAYLVDGGDSGNVANTPSDGRQTVRIAKAQGYEFIKVYSHLNIETYKAIIDEANKQEMKVIGHIPNIFKGRTKEAFVPHFDMVAHAEEFSSQTDIYTYKEAQRLAKMAKDNGTWVTPNLSNLVKVAEQARSLDGILHSPNFKYVHPLMQSKWITSNQYNRGTNVERIAYFDKLVDFHVTLVKAFIEADVPMVAGTDAGTSGIIWGFSLHDELELLVEAGLTPEQALASASRLPATWLEIGDKIGTVEVGKYADLILLDANPLDNISNTRKISGVFVNGRWVSKEKIDVMLADLAAKNNLNKDRYDWAKRREYEQR